MYKPFHSKSVKYFDPAHSGNDIEIYTYSDGLGRIVQTKKDADVNGVEEKVISGRVKYDALGRAVENYYPTTQALGDTTYFTELDDIPPSITLYDILDRPLRQEAPDETFQTFSYGFGQDAIGHTLFKTTVVDQNGHPSIMLKDVNELQWGLKPAGQPYVYFAYDIMGQCDSVYSSQANDFCRKYTYDMLGRKTSYSEGHLSESYVYTGTNLTEKTMGWYNSITNQPDSKTLTYTYDYNRLIATVSSEYAMYYTEYVYDNNGRLVNIIDESGIQCFEYGNMGEITKSTRAYSLPTQAQPIALSTRFTYDSWGRMQQIIYPDGEVLDYAYDHGGQLKEMTGIKGGFNYSYLTDMQYDKFGAKTTMEYGNDVKTWYEYDPYNLRLTVVVVYKQSTWYHIMNYLYDDKGNITEINSGYDWLPGEIITQKFTYDSTDQLVTATGNTENDSIYSNAIEYGNWGKIQQYDIKITDPLTSNQTINHTDYTYPSSNINRTQTLFGVDSSNSNALNFKYDFGINGSLRRKENVDESEFYLFNAFNCMKAYSYNGERFGYYGYDASGERTYKIDFDATFSKENGVISVQSLDVEKMTLYPNGYVNINQNGEYTKHYYADALRIASKIGSGFTGNLCDSATATGYSSHLNIRMSLQSDIMVDELNEVVVPLQDIQQINPMPYPTFCNLDSGGQETNLFFYHPDHLGSTGLVTNNNASVIQGLFYAPFGEIISDYNPSFHDTLM
ncbi:MAG TPA: hypothetical protein PKX15_08960, partial [Bacteroidales bacterium]|nr:hypothetical protein [Bacteroidales bacterium]